MTCQRTDAHELGDCANHHNDGDFCPADAYAYPCVECEESEDIAASAAGHPEACSYTIGATRVERVEHYRTHEPVCNYFGEAR